MYASVCRVCITVADALTESADQVTVAIGGALGAWAGYTYYPGTWSGEWRIVATGVIAVIGAIAINTLAGVFIAPLRRLIGKAGRPLSSPRGRTAPVLPDTLEEGLAQAAAATAADATHRAATAAWRIDQGDNFLRDDARWQGCENGEAFFYLAPAVWLHYRSKENKVGREPHFALLTSDSDQPVPITSLVQIRDHLMARSDGFPSVSDAREASELHPV